MFEARRAMFLYAVSPVHVGAGTALGAIDNPIQRERHTGHPMISGSGLKGAFRHSTGLEDAEVERIFGPAPSAGDASAHAGNLSISDAQVVLFPVRSLKHSYVYATCPTALARLGRLLVEASVEVPWLASPMPSVSDEGGRPSAIGNVNELGQQTVLETYEFAVSGGVDPIGRWLASAVLPSAHAYAYFSKKIERHTVLISDERFGFFARNATIVEPHVCIDDATGTARGGGLFYTENVPPETVFASLVMSTRERSRSGGNRSAAETMAEFTKHTDGKMLQVGGDATTGRGQMVTRFAGKGDRT
jgi:CRISPR-associated protein Cmr4